MNEKKIAGLLYLLTVLVCLNLGISAYLLFRPATAPAPGASAAARKIFASDAVNSLARTTVDLYNAGKSAELYERFDDLARIQFTQQAMSEQVSKLHSLLGTIGDYAYDRTEPASTQDGRQFYTLIYKVRLKGGPFANGELKLMVFDKEGSPALVGFFVYGRDSGR